VGGALLTVAAHRRLAAQPPGGAARWQRTNFRGREVSLLSGPALAAGAAVATLSPAAVVAGAGACAVGAYDDAAADADKGFRGHAAALRQGRLTAGTVKVLGIGATGAVAAALVGPRGRRDLLLGGAVVAGSANLLNLLDLRPGRALKAGTALAVVLREPGVAGACLAELPGDLAERTMLGDAGANALGAILGTSLLRQVSSGWGRGLALAALVGLTAASERVSFSAVIDRTPALRWADRLGRRA
jgi:hypothetical protein